MSQIIEDLTVLHIVTTLITETVLVVGFLFADDRLFSDQHANVMVVLKGLLPLQGVMVCQGSAVLIRHLDLCRSSLNTRTSGITRIVGRRTIVTVRRNMTTLITYIRTNSEVFGELIAHISLDIPLVIHLHLVVITNGGQRVVKRAKGLICFITGSIVFGKQIRRSIYYTVTQTGLRSGSVILNGIRTRTEHLGVRETCRKTDGEVLERFELNLTGDVITHVIRLLHDSLIVNAVIRERKGS